MMNVNGIGRKVAIVDMGSNSIRLLLGTLQKGVWHNEPKRLWTTRLGDRHRDGSLKQERMEASFEALSEIYTLAQMYGASDIYGFATSAVRESTNGKEFLTAAKSYCPMYTRILTGEEEAYYGFQGALQTYLPDGKQHALIDVGGGSTEVALGSIKGVAWSTSYLAGAVRLQSVSEEGPQAVWEATQRMWLSMPMTEPFGVVVAVGGTATTLGAIDVAMDVYDSSRIQGHMMSRETIEGLVMRLRYMSMEERRQVVGLPAGRADIIVSGGEIITSFLDFYGISTIYISDTDGMEGIQASLYDS